MPGPGDADGDENLRGGGGSRVYYYLFCLNLYASPKRSSKGEPLITNSSYHSS